jgi:hypothetical protein
MEHFYGTEEIDPETLEDLELADDGKVELNLNTNIFLCKILFFFKAGYDPEDMFHTNREKFNTTTDFDESKYSYVFISVN